MILSDYVLSAPRRGEPGICRLRYDRNGANIALFAQLAALFM